MYKAIKLKKPYKLDFSKLTFINLNIKDMKSSFQLVASRICNKSLQLTYEK